MIGLVITKSLNLDGMVSAEQHNVVNKQLRPINSLC